MAMTLEDAERVFGVPRSKLRARARKMDDVGYELRRKGAELPGVGAGGCGRGRRAWSWAPRLLWAGETQSLSATRRVAPRARLRRPAARRC